MEPTGRQATSSLDRFLTACRGGRPDRPPAWMMRQAGRTLPEYRALRDRHSFWEICTTPELAAEATLQPVRRFPVDAAIIFSDILVVPAAMGIPIEFTPAPVLGAPVRTRADVDRLVAPHVETDLKYVADAIACVRREAGATHAVLGFAGAPYTLACYMVDGGGRTGFPVTRALMESDPGLMHDLLAKTADAVADYLTMQVEAGVTAFQLFDTWAGELDRESFRRFALPYAVRVFERVKRADAFSIYYVNGVAQHLASLGGSGADILGIDGGTSLGRVRSQRGPDRVVQGNLPPDALFDPVEKIRGRVFAMLDETGGRGHIVNLGHGLRPDTPLAGIEAFLAAVADWSDGKEAQR